MDTTGSALDPISLNISGVSQLVGSQVNKINQGVYGNEGEIGQREDELSLELSDEELRKLANKWEVDYAPYEGKIKPRQDKNKAWYMGRQGEGSYIALNGLPIASNILFEAVETFIPAALAKNPEPVVWSDNTPEGNELSGDLKTMLQYHTDVLELRTKLSQATRSWCFNFLGCLKTGWDPVIKEVRVEVVNPQNLIFSNVTKPIDAYGDYEGTIGERKTCTAGELAEKFPKKKDFISLVVDGKMGTEVLYTEWTSDEYCFYTFKGEVLDKAKNPHFNYPKKVPGMDEEGNEITTEEQGKNHFARPKKMYTFLSVFSSGDMPHDITGLIEQNIPNQNRITQREMQIDVNLNNANNGLVLSENNFNQETGKQAATARQKGRPILVPEGGPIDQAVVTLPSPGIPDAFFKAADRDKQDLRSIFGVDGLGTVPPAQQKTLGGLELNEAHDGSRIGGGIGDKLQLVAKSIYNNLVQMYYVYYDVHHFAAIMGQMKAVEYVILRNTNLDRRFVVSVAPDSMKPKDELTEMNQAMSLWEAKAIDIKTLLTRLNFPDPQETAGQAWLYQTNPQLYGQLNFPELNQEIQQLIAQQVPPSQAVQQPNQPIT